MPSKPTDTQLHLSQHHQTSDIPKEIKSSPLINNHLISYISFHIIITFIKPRSARI